MRLVGGCEAHRPCHYVGEPPIYLLEVSFSFFALVFCPVVLAFGAAFTFRSPLSLTGLVAGLPPFFFPASPPCLCSTAVAVVVATCCRRTGRVFPLSPSRRAGLSLVFPDVVAAVQGCVGFGLLGRVPAGRASLYGGLWVGLVNHGAWMVVLGLGYASKLGSVFELDIVLSMAKCMIPSLISGRGVRDSESMKNENLEVKESNPKTELVEIKRKIPRLVEQLGHGKTKWVKEKQILKELEHLQRREVLLDGKIKEAEPKIPKSIERRPRYLYWYYDSMNKYELKQHLCSCLKEIKEHEEQEKVAKMQRIPQMVELEKQISSLEKKYNILKQEEQKTKDCLLALEFQVNKQIALYEKYCKVQKMVQELATQKKLVTLEKLSLKEIEEFMSRWTNDNEFRANYIRSIQLSLANRDLCCDGRMLLND
uniref:Uncharacterized protein n=1 Tax=Chenopodium quinoa TaxID=63459 RepID=A0A803LZS5_CHEQI